MTAFAVWLSEGETGPEQKERLELLICVPLTVDSLDSSPEGSLQMEILCLDSTSL